MKLYFLRKSVVLGVLLIIIVGISIGWLQASAASENQPESQTSMLHPTFFLLDAEGKNVLESQQPLSTMKTCGQCHDSNFILEHSFHADLGLSEWSVPGSTGSGRPWDTSNGIFGKWDALTYRYLTPIGDERLDLSTAEWVKLYADRFVGGWPGMTSRNGKALNEISLSLENPETTILNPETGEIELWDWNQSGFVEMNCFICHLDAPNNQARVETIRAGDFASASTATLLGSGIVERTGEGLEWNREAFQEDGELLREYITIQDPSNNNCAQCHGLAHEGDDPLTFSACSLENPQTATTGQVFSPQKISASGMNISGKSELTFAWDIHAERQVQCTACHFSLNNPAYVQTSPISPSSLLYDPRKLDIQEYLQRPIHNFARGQSAQFTITPELKDTMRRCETCHEAQKTHADWLPYVERHMAVMACETCHIPQMYAPAIQSYDWTVLKPNGQPVTSCRGVEGEEESTLITGYQPILLMRRNVEGTSNLAPYNLITTWYWTYDDAKGNTRPVRLLDLQAAYFEEGAYADDIVIAFDENQNHQIDDQELIINTQEKEQAVIKRLTALGLNNPRLVGEIQPYSINHNVARGDQVIGDCRACHGTESRITQSFQLANTVPGEVMPSFVQDANVFVGGDIFQDEDGALYYQPRSEANKIYAFGHDKVPWIDWVGWTIFIGTLVGINVHSSVRYFVSRRQIKRKPQLKRVYMYHAYERFWHWLQTIAIVLLLITGIIIHRPDIFGFISFRYMVTIHNVVAVILGVNAVFSLFYHLVSGEIKQYIPRPYGFFDQAILQAKYYLRGIFQQEAHPFEKTPDKKLNPLQQITYFMILNVLLPIQGLSGILMWGVQKFPKIANLLGGLPVLAPIHTLSAWLFATFLALHLYLLTTSGHTATTSLQAMINGWEEVEILDDESPDSETPENPTPPETTE